MKNPLLIHKANKSDKKAIQRFYKANNYSASFIGFDTCYLIKENDIIIACVIVSLGDVTNELKNNATKDASAASTQVQPQYLLHGLVVTQDHQKQGYATQLLAYALLSHSRVICFADPSLNKLYLNAGFKEVEKEALKTHLKPKLLSRYNSYLQHKNTLKVYARFKR